MPRMVLSIVLFLLIPLGFTSASAANTWAGVWNSDFGRMTLGASGSGNYEGYSPGTVSGQVTGNVNKGTWQQPGDPPKSGTFEWTLSGDGKSFSGVWAYANGGCGTACGWSGTCVSGACLKNGSTPVTPPSGGMCKPGSARAAATADCKRRRVRFSFHVDGFPSSPDEKELPTDLVAVELKTSGTKLVSESGSKRYSGQGTVSMTTTYLELGGGQVERSITFQVRGWGGYESKDGLRTVGFHAVVRNSDDPNCPEETRLGMTLKGAKGRTPVARIGRGCLSSDGASWRGHKFFKQASISRPAPFG